jgi:hypothetical protein
VNNAGTIVTVCAVLLAYSAMHIYVNFFRPELWLRFRGERGNRQYEQRILSDDLFVAKCRMAGVFGVIGVVASGYGLYLNVPKLF